MLDNNILQPFMQSFFGYGNLAAPLWCIGMEEGGGKTLNEIQLRLRAWEERGRRPIDDVAEFHRAFGQEQLFRANAPVQKTWQCLKILGGAPSRGVPTHLGHKPRRHTDPPHYAF
jgi:hypothetical protein